MKKRKIFEHYENSYQEIWLPQMRCDYDYIVKNLQDLGVKFSIQNLALDDIHPLQKTVNLENSDYFSNKIQNREPIEPIFVSANNEILDGHHRFNAFKGASDIDKITCIKIPLEKKDAARILNKIQDKFEFEKELEGNAPIDEEELMEPDTEQGNDEKKSFTLYRSKPIENSSKSGNFFLMDRKPKHDHEYDVEFDNLHEITDEEIGDKNPILYVAEKWFGDLKQLEETATKVALTYETYLKRKLAETAKSKGHDGIKYGSKFIQAV